MFLDKIVARVQERLPDQKKAMPLPRIMEELPGAPPPRDFAGALRRAGFAIIAEVKKASPARGWLHQEMDILKQAEAYERGGASAVSVLTEPDFFKGSLADLRAVRDAITLPVLRKDFVVERYQVYEARLNGADALLLIVAILTPGTLGELIKLTRELGMAPLVEVHSKADTEIAVRAGARVIGINNRNLADFSVDLDTSLRLRPLIPADITVVSESGIATAEDAARLKAAGVNAILVGEALVKADDPVKKIKELMGVKI
ncbi:MAG: indole-3-glycerol phosphate synthase TrpC [Chloroflexi bacterium]|nr:indole-3-glycerol phosphate synthase TrpC [Chloroflexota bacterium]